MTLFEYGEKLIEDVPYDSGAVKGLPQPTTTLEFVQSLSDNKVPMFFDLEPQGIHK
jgi:hypothetical protein